VSRTPSTYNPPKNAKEQEELDLNIQMEEDKWKKTKKILYIFKFRRDIKFINRGRTSGRKRR
jgi:hypothetical protein